METARKTCESRPGAEDLFFDKRNAEHVSPSLHLSFMQPIRLLSVVEQTVEHLRKGLHAGRWGGRLPGVVRLAAECDVSAGVVRAALLQLESEGLLSSQGLGRSRIIASRPLNTDPLRPLRVGFLMHDAPSGEQSQTAQILLQIQHDLEAAGNTVFFSRKSQVELGYDVSRITRYVRENPADAWLVVAGSRELLQWFASQPVPAIALYGRTDGVQIARTGPDKVAAYIAATRALIELGHRRIVLITRRPRRKPTPGNAECAFLQELAKHGIAMGDFNLPEWEETPKGFSTLLETLFRLTPPTALIIEESPRLVAAMLFLLERGIKVPEQVSLVSAEYDNTIEWCHPAFAHMRGNSLPIVRRIVRWVTAAQRGNADCTTINFPAKFIPGGTIGPVWKG